jgi:hypothetical protein
MASYNDTASYWNRNVEVAKLVQEPEEYAKLVENAVEYSSGLGIGSSIFGGDTVYFQQLVSTCPGTPRVWTGSAMVNIEVGDPPSISRTHDDYGHEWVRIAQLSDNQCNIWHGININPVIIPNTDPLDNLDNVGAVDIVIGDIGTIYPVEGDVIKAQSEGQGIVSDISTYTIAITAPIITRHLEGTAPDQYYSIDITQRWSIPIKSKVNSGEWSNMTSFTVDIGDTVYAYSTRNGVSSPVVTI